jgi:hypothetical protein
MPVQLEIKDETGPGIQDGLIDQLLKFQIVAKERFGVIAS